MFKRRERLLEEYHIADDRAYKMDDFTRLIAGFWFMAHRQLENSSLVKGIVVGTTALVTGETLLYPVERHEPLEKGRSSHTANSRVIVEPIFGHLTDRQRWKKGKEGRRREERSEKRTERKERDYLA